MGSDPMDTAEGITDDERDRLTDLKSKLDEVSMGSDPRPHGHLDGVVVELSQSENDGLIVALTDLGEAPADRSVARELLEANHLFAGTAGATLSLEAKSNRVFLQQKMYPVSVHGV